MALKLASEHMPRGGGSDHASFNAVGVPGFFTMETGRSNYTYLHHTQHDVLDAPPRIHSLHQGLHQLRHH